MPKLDNWSITSREVYEDPYIPPELMSKHLQGTVSGNPEFPDGSHIITSRIVAVYGRTVVTRTGSSYTLGEPDPSFVEWCIKKEINLDKENPIKIIRY
jgi:hypothetical protein